MADPLPVVRSKPVADQVTDILRERILDGVYPPDQRMPSEAQLAEELGVSRASLRTALASLAAEGHLRRRHGDGTYPCPPNFRITLRTGGDWDIERQIAQSGRSPSMRVLESGPRRATRQEAEKLKLARGEKVFSIRRLFFADKSPVALIESCIAAEGLAPDLPASEAGIAPHKFLVLHHERKPHDGEIRFSAVAADETLVSLLEVPRSSPLLSMTGIYYDKARQPLMLAREVYRAEEGFEMRTGLQNP